MKTYLLKLAAAAALITVAVALTPNTPVSAAGEWSASYWNNKNLKGNPVKQRNETKISYAWRNGSPIPGTVNKDVFSIRWTRTVHFNEGTYIFRTTSDDGIRVWVDGKKIIDQWNDHAFQTYIIPRDMSEGDHNLKVEYYENKGLASVTFGWARQKANPWQAKYYKGTKLKGTAIVVRNENAIRNFWGAAPPAPKVPGLNFSVRYTRTMNFPGGDVRFKVTVSDGFKLYVDDDLILDKWYDHGVETHTIKRNFGAGSHTVRLDFYNHSYPAVLRLKIKFL